jgi:hypothetical protein
MFYEAGGELHQFTVKQKWYLFNLSNPSGNFTHDQV